MEGVCMANYQGGLDDQVQWVAVNFREYLIILGINSENFIIFLESYPQIFIFAQKRSTS